MKKEGPEHRKKAILNGKSTGESAGTLAHELGVHREELKAQNEELRHTQLELSRARDRYKELFDSAPVAYLVLDSNRTIREANLTAASLLGTPRNDLIGTHLSRFMDREAADAYHVLMMAVLDRGTQRSRDLEFRRPDGSFFHGHLETSPYEDILLGKGWRIALLDITESKRAEESLYQAHARSEWLARFPEENPSPVLRASSEGMALYCNPAAMELDGWKCKADQQLPEHLLPLVGQAMAEGREVRQDMNPSERAYAVTVVPIPEEGYANVYGRDITERKLMEEALRKAKDELEERVKERTYELYTESFYARSLIEASLDPLVTISVDGKITDANHASEEAIGVSREQLIGSDFSDYFTEPEKARAGYEEVFRQGAVRDYPLELKRRDGRVIPVLYNASVYRDKTGRNMGVFAAARDITERKQTESVLRRLASELAMAEERERKRIAGVLHDDIAQTLATVRLRLDLLQGFTSDRSEQLTLREAKTLLVQSLQQTRALMNDLGNPVLFDVGPKAACEALAKQMMAIHPVRIICDIRDSFKDLNPDVKTILFQSVKELLNNVARHSRAHHAHVMIDRENKRLRVKVTDDGVGFDSRVLGMPTAEGGFGLYNIRERLLAIGGSLRIESNPGTGTVVTATLPAELD